jgi:ABC-type phosphate/phosphonate transport system permease subunit
LFYTKLEVAMHKREVALLRLEEKIRNKSAVIGIVGIGYVGLPLCHYCHSEPRLVGAKNLTTSQTATSGALESKPIC